MGLIENVLSGMGEVIPYEPCFKAVLFGGGAAYFENICGIKSYSPDEVILTVKGGGLTVRGKNMYIKKFCAGDVAICGQVFSIERI